MYLFQIRLQYNMSPSGKKMCIRDRVINVIVCLVVGFLKTDNAVHAMLFQIGILFGFQGDYLNLQVAEIR